MRAQVTESAKTANPKSYGISESRKFLHLKLFIWTLKVKWTSLILIASVGERLVISFFLSNAAFALIGPLTSPRL
ncbi:hypothetical protein OPV22_014622 [Ensete ventricosum]|uniref:Uncharacterized protein n=1 Tax=Ensete ventricosum TaxID=4639 RepID=A0AAV8RCA9_ENSVE|nr:hypothetical protein OPV22_014622 [Ensete ventricosum]